MALISEDDTPPHRTFKRLSRKRLEDFSSLASVPKTISTGDEKWTFRYPSLFSEGRIIFFTPSIFINVRREGPYWVACNIEFGIEALARSFKTAIEGVGSEVVMLWDHIAREADQNLTASARVLKRRLLKQVRVRVGQ